DLGCGSALSSIFLAKEFGCRVWASDLWVAPSSNWGRIRDAGVTDLVTPLSVEAHALPFADGFFDAVVSLDAYHYFGTDELYLPELARLVRDGGRIGIVVPGHAEDDDRAGLSFHSERWWERLWQRTPQVTVERAEMLPGGHELWRRSDQVSIAWEGKAWIREDDRDFLEGDVGRGYGFVRMVARVGATAPRQVRQVPRAV